MAKPITPILSLHVRGNRAQKREVTCGEGVDPGDHRSWALGCRRWSREQLLSMHGVASLRDKETEAQIGKEEGCSVSLAGQRLGFHASASGLQVPSLVGELSSPLC